MDILCYFQFVRVSQAEKPASIMLQQNYWKVQAVQSQVEAKPVVVEGNVEFFFSINIE